MAVKVKKKNPIQELKDKTQKKSGGYNSQEKHNTSGHESCQSTDFGNDSKNTDQKNKKTDQVGSNKNFIKNEDFIEQDRSENVRSENNNQSVESSDSDKNFKESNANQNSSGDNQSSSDSSNKSGESDFGNIQEELESWKEKALRYAADVQNLQKQHEIDLGQARKSTKKSVLTQILPFVGTLYLSIKYAPKSNDESVTKFVNMLSSSFNLLVKDLEKSAIELIVPEAGEPFNPEFMESLSSGSDSEPKVSQLVSIGMKIEGFVVQPAVVILE